MPELAKRRPRRRSALSGIPARRGGRREHLSEPSPAWGDADRATSTARVGVGQAAGDPDADVGSNNWVIAGGRTPAESRWSPATRISRSTRSRAGTRCHLQGRLVPRRRLAYVGMPAVMIGRNRAIAWGITNNICSQRDLYQERTDPAHPGCFLHDGRMEARTGIHGDLQGPRTEPAQARIFSSSRGPIVDDHVARTGESLGTRVAPNGSARAGWLADGAAGDEPGAQLRRVPRSAAGPGTCRRFRSCSPTSREISATRPRAASPCGKARARLSDRLGRKRSMGRFDCV